MTCSKKINSNRRIKEAKEEREEGKKGQVKHQAGARPHSPLGGPHVRFPPVLDKTRPGREEEEDRPRCWSRSPLQRR